MTNEMIKKIINLVKPPNNPSDFYRTHYKDFSRITKQINCSDTPGPVPKPKNYYKLK